MLMSRTWGLAAGLPECTPARGCRLEERRGRLTTLRTERRGVPYVLSDQARVTGISLIDKKEMITCRMLLRCA